MTENSAMYLMMASKTDIPPSPSNISPAEMDFNYDDDDTPSGPNSHIVTTDVDAGNYGTNLPTPGTPKSHVGEHYGDHGEGGKIPITKACYTFAFCAALNSCNLGYDIGVNTDAGPMLKRGMDLSNVEFEIFTGSLNLFAMIGALFAHSISDRFGRRGAFVVAAAGFIFGVLVMSCAGSYGMLMFGRIFVGLGVGFGLAIDPVYIAEISPAAHRGYLVTWSEIATNVGIVFGFCSGLVFYNVHEDIAWRLMFGMGTILPAAIIILVIFVMPESPRWLVSRNRDEEAKVILQQVYPPGYNVNAVVEDIKEAIERETEAENAVGWDAIFFPTPAFKRMLIVGIGTAISQQVVGIDAIQYYLVFILKESGITARATQSIVLIFLGLLKMSVVVLAGNLFDKNGRRPLMFASLAGMAVALFILSVSFFSSTDNAFVSVFALAMYLAFFSLGMGPGAWLIPSEVFSTTIRAKAMSVATFMNRVMGTLLNSTMLSVSSALSFGGYFLMLCIVCGVVAVFFHVLLPETKGRSLEDMSMYFAEITGDQSVIEAERRLRSRVSANRSEAGAAGVPEAGGNNGTYA